MAVMGVVMESQECAYGEGYAQVFEEEHVCMPTRGTTTATQVADVLLFDVDVGVRVNLMLQTFEKDRDLCTSVYFQL